MSMDTQIMVDCNKCDKVRKLTDELINLRIKIQNLVMSNSFYTSLKELEKDNLEKISELESDLESQKQEEIKK